MKILAVEDERHILRMIQVNLQRAGYSVQTATCAQETLRIVEEQQPELVIISIPTSQSTYPFYQYISVRKA